MGTVYSNLVRDRGTTIFIDVDEDIQGERMLVITDARMTRDKKDCQVIRISAESFASFLQAVNGAGKEMMS